jgi:membrane-bound ClpP family serine protease
MDISIAGYKLSLVTLLLIGLVMFILTGHTICGCCEVQGFEGFTEGMTKMVKKEGMGMEMKDKKAHSTHSKM